MSEKIAKAIAIGYLAKVSAANVNASHTEGNVIVAKKITLPDGTTLPYISGQAVRRMLRDRLQDLGYKLSEGSSKVKGQEVKPPAEPWKYIDEDLFGYLDPSGQKRRTSPVRVSPLIGMFHFQGDRDLGTRSFERFGEGMGAGGNMFETELYANLFKGSMLVELDRVGVYYSIETGEKEEKRIDLEEKKNRLKSLFDALNLLWGGGRTARMLADISPKFLAYTRLSAKHPVFLEAFSVEYESGQYKLILEPLESALEKFKDYRLKTIFGVDPGIFGNENEICERLGKFGDVVSVKEAIDKAKGDVDEQWREKSSE